MYTQTNWKDDVRNPDSTFTMVTNPDGTVKLTRTGTVIQQGTNMSATNFNNAEGGIQDNHIAELIQIMYNLQRGRIVDERLDGMAAEFLNEVRNINLTNTSSFPFNNSVLSVNLLQARKTLNYNVFAEVVSYSGGLVGEISITDKQLNGFKVSFSGSAKAVTLKLRIMGGMLV